MRSPHRYNLHSNISQDMNNTSPIIGYLQRIHQFLFGMNRTVFFSHRRIYHRRDLKKYRQFMDLGKKI
jgi:hypothetical protein